LTFWFRILQFLWGGLISSFPPDHDLTGWLERGMIELFGSRYKNDKISHPHPQFELLIISNFGYILADFQGRRFSLLWRLSHHHFKAREFPR
jgi:hypothetical protein